MKEKFSSIISPSKGVFKLSGIVPALELFRVWTKYGSWLPANGSATAQAVQRSARGWLGAPEGTAAESLGRQSVG